MLVGNLAFNSTNPLRPTGERRPVSVEGNGGFALPLPGCEGDSDILSPKQRIEISVGGLAEDAGLDLWIADEIGTRVARLSTTADKKGLRGMRYSPDCSRTYALHGRTLYNLRSPLAFTLRSRVVAAGKTNPWTASQPFLDGIRPSAIADIDGDGIIDELDNCADAFNPTQADEDRNGQGDACEGACDGTACPLRVTIDAKPGNERNLLRLRSNGSFKVAVLSREDFNANDLDLHSILVAGAPLLEGRKGLPTKVSDVDRDGRDDLVLSISVPAMNLDEETTALVLVAHTKDGRDVYGTDAVTVAP